MKNNYTNEMLRLAQNFEVIEAQADRWRRSLPGHEKWSEEATECVNFVEGRQWTEAEKAKLRFENRPILTKNKIAPLTRLLLGYFRQNRYDIKLFPGSDGRGTQEIADTLTATLKQIAEANQADWQDAQVMQDGLYGGRGFWDVRLDFSRNRYGEISETVLDPHSVVIDAEGDTYEPQGWGHCMNTRWMSPADIWMLYGDKGLEEIDSIGRGEAADVMPDGVRIGGDGPPRYFGQNVDDFVYSDFNGQYNASPFEHVNRFRKVIRVLDCQHRVLRRVKALVDIQTGAELILPEDWKRDRIQRVIEWGTANGQMWDAIEEPRKVVRWTVTAGDRVLHDEWSPYDDFTIIPFFPYFRRGHTRGMVNDLLDPQREINRRASSALHVIMTSANSGWKIPVGSVTQDMMRAIEEKGGKAGFILEYDPKIGIPEKIIPSAPPTLIQQLEQKADNDLKDISGVNDSALGQNEKVESGRAIQAKQHQAVVGAEMYFDNFSRSRELKARFELSIIQKYYTEERLIRIRSGNGGQPQEVWMNRKDAAGAIVNNVTLGRYDMAIEEAPISATFLQGQFAEAMALIEKGAPIPWDIAIDLSSIGNKETIKQRMDEQRMLQEAQAKAQALGAAASVGVPPGQPIPAVPVTAEAVSVVDSAGGGMPPQGGEAPMVALPPPSPQIAGDQMVNEAINPQIPQI